MYPHFIFYAVEKLVFNILLTGNSHFFVDNECSFSVRRILVLLYQTFFLQTMIFKKIDKAFNINYCLFKIIFLTLSTIAFVLLTSFLISLSILLQACITVV